MGGFSSIGFGLMRAKYTPATMMMTTKITTTATHVGTSFLIWHPSSLEIRDPATLAIKDYNAPLVVKTVHVTDFSL